MRRYGLTLAAAWVLVLAASGVAAQPRLPPAAPAVPEAAAQVPADPLGRDTPRGSVLGFLAAARAGQHEIARQYLDTRLTATAADALAHQLFVVLDARLPARLQQISDSPEGSRANPLRPEREVIGVIRGASGDVEICVDRIQRGQTGPIWLFSAGTLDAIPEIYTEVSRAQGAMVLPDFLTNRQFAGLRLLEWIVVLVGLPLFFVATAGLNRLLIPLTRPLWRRLAGAQNPHVHNALPLPARLLLLTVAGWWLLSILPLSLRVRQLWSSSASLITIVAVVWLLILLNGQVESAIRRHVPRASSTAAAALLRVLRRVVDLLFIFGGFLATLRHFGVDPTPALAGLGVGGIAIALAAQKTLENVIAGASLIFDQAVRVGDFLKMGETMGTVDHIGLRSTRIRTLDRTVVSVPNGQIANASLETISARDMYWFHPDVRLRYETTTQELRNVLENLRALLREHPSVERDSIRVRFVRLGPFSLDVEVFAYLKARDWNHFLQLQEELLFGVTETVERAGTGLALPSQTMYVAGAGAAALRSGALR